jgi:hypothetical protein
VRVDGSEEGLATGLEVGVDDVDANAPSIGERRDERAEGLGGATGAADHASEVLWVHAHLEHVAALRRPFDDLHLVRVIDDPLDQVFKRWSEQC